MSVRAYRVIEIKTEKSDSFNLWHDEALNNELSKSGYYDGMNDGSGMFDISISALREIVANLSGELNPDVKEALEKDIKATEEQGKEYIQYYCY